MSPQSAKLNSILNANSPCRWFKVYRSDRNQFGGGVMLLVNNNLRHDSFSLHPLSGLEATAICLQLQNHNCFSSPPAVTIAPTELDAIFSLHDTVVLAGDLKCKHVSWNNASVNKNGSPLLSYCLNKAITINYPNQPTHFPYNSYPSVLDIALSQRCTTSKSQSVPALTRFTSTWISLHPRYYMITNTPTGPSSDIP